MEYIPYLSISRSLGDFWSYNPHTKSFIVSPKPDVSVHPLNPKEQQFIVIASDGLWDVMSPDKVVQYIWDYEKNDDVYHQPRDVGGAIIKEALQQWNRKHLPADNITILIAFLTPSTSSLAYSATDSVQESSPASPSVIALSILGKHCRAEDDKKEQL